MRAFYFLAITGNCTNLLLSLVAPPLNTPTSSATGPSSTSCHSTRSFPQVLVNLGGLKQIHGPRGERCGPLKPLAPGLAWPRRLRGLLFRPEVAAYTYLGRCGHRRCSHFVCVTPANTAFQRRPAKWKAWLSPATLAVLPRLSRDLAWAPRGRHTAAHAVSAPGLYARLPLFPQHRSLHERCTRFSCLSPPLNSLTHTLRGLERRPGEGSRESPQPLDAGGHGGGLTLPCPSKLIAKEFIARDDVLVEREMLLPLSVVGFYRQIMTALQLTCD
ncbi:PREDICTED: uncharacterized protein LOC105599502 [Cercocebus atys]|uniref:uncharacterized protein LOC105599502 n=1 Tax=Cercocebus atys TaxID=9531 RepID=UPI0005F37C3D|nr:PREDICTED: uncharacterized protein LOC105599502 [Cercocebus atys]